MASGNNDGKGRPPADDDGRSLLFGVTDDGGEAGADPGVPPGAGEAPAETAAALEGIAATLGRLEARLSALQEMLAAERASGPGLSEVATQIVGASAKIARAAEAVARIEKTTADAARFTGDTRDATGVLQAEAGKQIAGLKEGRRELDAAVARLASRAEGLKAREDALGKGIGELRAVWKSMNECSRAVASEAGRLANNYKEWTAGVAAHRQEMAALSQDLRQGGARMEKSVTRSLDAQRDISLKILGNVESFRGENESFLKRFAAGGEKVLGAIRRERKAVRRWTVPSLSAALAAAVLSFPVLGGYAQSQFGVFDAYDDSNGWKQLMWERHGGQVKECLIESERRGTVLRCELRVDGRGLFGTPADELPPIPGEG